MKKQIRKIGSLILCIILCLGCGSTGVWAEDTGEKGPFSDDETVMTALTEDVECGSMEILYEEEDTSICKLLLHDIRSSVEIQKISIAVWSLARQKDLYWYEANKAEDKEWSANLSISNHTGALSGSFQIQVYAYDTEGNRYALGTTSAEMMQIQPEIIPKLTAEGLKLTLKHCSVENAKSVIFWVDREGDDQDALKKCIAGKESDGSWQVLYGKLTRSDRYEISCYGVDESDRLIFQKSISYVAEIPSIQSVRAEVPEEYDGSFRIVIEAEAFPDRVKTISVPVWCADDQSDMVWYKAERVEDSTWVVEGDISRHKNHLGHYKAHVYVIDQTGTQRYCGKTEFQMTPPPLTVTAHLDESGQYILAKAVNVTPKEAIRFVRFAVWTDYNGQDDLRWYTAELNGITYSAKIPLSNHPGEGTIRVHAYLLNTSNVNTYLAGTDLKVTPTADASLVMEEFNADRYSADMKVILSNVSGTVTKVAAAIWSEEDQSNLAWYSLNKSHDGNWYGEFQPSKHGYRLGEYQIHIYATFSGGSSICILKTSYQIDGNDQVCIRDNEDGTVSIFYYPDEEREIGKIRARVWSEEGGQDDLKILTLRENADAGCFSASISIRDFLHSGPFICQIYVGSEMVSEKAFSFSEKIGKTESVSRTPVLGNGDVKFFHDLLLGGNAGSDGKRELVLMTTEGSIIRRYKNIVVNWLYVLEEENLVVYSNFDYQIGILKLDSDYNILWNRIIEKSVNLPIDPTMVKTGEGYLLTITDIAGPVNNANPTNENGVYTIRTFRSTDLKTWTEGKYILSESYNIEDADLVEKDGVLYLVYEKEVADKSYSSIMVKISKDNGQTWSKAKELIPADCDHEPASFLADGDRFILFYSADKEKVGSSYMGAKAYYAVFDKNLNLLVRDQEIKTQTKGGILLYDVAWNGTDHYIVYSENYLTDKILSIEKAA